MRLFPFYVRTILGNISILVLHSAEGKTNIIVVVFSFCSVLMLLLKEMQEQECVQPSFKLCIGRMYISSCQNFPIRLVLIMHNFLTYRQATFPAGALPCSVLSRCHTFYACRRRNLAAVIAWLPGIAFFAESSCTFDLASNAQAGCAVSNLFLCTFFACAFVTWYGHTHIHPHVRMKLNPICL